jgi:hypothetical protein
MLSLNDTFQFLIPQHLPGWVIVLKVIFITISLILFGLIVYFLIYTDYLYYRFFEGMEDFYKWKEQRKRKEALEKKIKKDISKISSPPLKETPIENKEWERIFDKLRSSKKIGYKIALIDADRLLDKKLKDLGVRGRNLSERIENVSETLIPNIKELKKARGMVNQILREDKEFSRKEIEEGVKIYKKAYDLLKEKS